MRTLVLVVTCLVSLEAAAKCAGEWLGVAPEKGTELPPSAHVLVTLGGRHQPVKLEQLEFVAGDAHVPAREVNRFEGYRQVMLLLAPQKPLAPGAWELVMTLPNDPIPSRRFGPWKVKKEADTTAPAFLSTPSMGATTWNEYGCGPGSSVEVKGVKTSEPGFIEARATVGGKTSTAVFQAANDAVGLGHGMCSGGFAFAPGEAVSVVLTPLDYAGNRGPSTVALTFTAPGPTGGSK